MKQQMFTINEGTLTARCTIEGDAIVQCPVPKTLIDARSENPRVPFVAMTPKRFVLRAGDPWTGIHVIKVLSCRPSDE